MDYSENDSKEFKKVCNTMNQLMTQSQQNEKDYNKFQEMFQYLLLNTVSYKDSLQAYEQIKATLTPVRNQEVLQRRQHQTIKLQKLYKTFKVSRIVLLHNLNLIVEHVENVLDEIVDKHLQNWRDKQKLGHTNDDQSTDVLIQIQNWCENLAKMLWSTRSKLRMGPMYNLFLNELDQTIPAFLKHFFEDVSNLLVCLVKHTIVIENQPPQVLLSNATFSTNIRLLVGDTLNIKKMKPSVDVSIESEADIQCGELKNSSGKIKFDKKSSKLVATFDALKFNKDFYNKPHDSEDNVTEAKFTLYFQSIFSINGDDELEINIGILSRPIIMIDHESQKPASNIVVTQDNISPVYNYQPFDLTYFMKRLPSKLCLKMIVCALSEKKLVAPKLKPIIKQFLENMQEFALSRALSDGNEEMCNTFLRENKINFMEWFYSAIELTQNHLCELWNDNFIIGFIEEKTAENILLRCEPGTFLLRLSDNQDVALVIDYCALNKNNEKHVLHCDPLTSKELELRSLSDRILGLVELKMLYRKTLPNINKINAFGKYSSHQKEQNAEEDQMKALLSFSEIKLNCPIDSSIPTLPTTFTISLPSNTSYSFNYLFR